MPTQSAGGSRCWWHLGPLIALLLAVASGCSGGAAGNSLAGDQLPWPPPEPAGEPARIASATVPTVIPGDEDIYAAGTYVRLEDAMLLVAGKRMSFAVYGLYGFSPTVRPLSATVDILGIDEGDPTCYVAAANFAQDAWQFLSSEPGTELLFPEETGADYISNTKWAYIAVLLQGDVDFRINSVTFTADTDAPAPPTGLTAIPSLSDVSLDWDDTPEATSYRVYRATFSNMSDALPVVSSIEDSAFVDTDDIEETALYYYAVAAVGLGGESQKSAVADAYIPETDIPAPTNLRTVTAEPFEVTVGWDWEGTAPTRYNIYVKTVPQFDLRAPFFKMVNQPGTEETCTFEITPGLEYWFRVQGVKGFKKGHLSPAVEIETKEEWHWVPSEVVGPGVAPVKIEEVDGELTVCYMTLAERSVKMARRNGPEDWTVYPVPLDKDTDTFQDTEPWPDQGFAEHMDFAWNGEEFMIAAHSPLPASLWTAKGTPETGWDTQLAFGDYQFDVSQNTYGYNPDVEASPTEFGLTYSIYYGTGGGSVMFASTEDGETWAEHAVMSTSSSAATHSMEHFNDNWYVLAMIAGPVNPPGQPQDLKFYDRASGWESQTVITTFDYHMGVYNDLKRYGTHWLSPAFCDGDNSLYSVEGDASTWELDLIAGGTEDDFVGTFCKLAVLDDDTAVCVYLDNFIGWWLIARLEGGEWKPYASLLSAFEMAAPEVVFHEGDPYVAYYNMFDDLIYVARAVAPET